MVDVTNDKDLSFFAMALETAPINSNYLGLIKQANVEEPFEEYSNEVFADPVNKQFPIHSPEHTVISAVYLHKQASEIDLDTKERISEAINNWGLHDLETLLDGEEELSKTASSDMYLLPSKNKFPYYDIEGLIKTASTATGYLNTMPIVDRVETASNLLKTANELGLSKDEIPQWAFVYGQELSSDLHKVAEALSVRYAVSENQGYKNILTKIAKLKNKVGDVSYDKSINRGIAFEMLELDKVAGITEKDVPDVFISVFNSTTKPNEEKSILSKIASEESVLIADTEFYKNDLVDFIENNNIKDVFGEDLVKNASTAGVVNSETLIDEVQNLPFDIQNVIAYRLQEQ